MTTQPRLTPVRGDTTMPVPDYDDPAALRRAYGSLCYSLALVERAAGEASVALDEGHSPARVLTVLLADLGRAIGATRDEPLGIAS